MWTAILKLLGVDPVGKLINGVVTWQKVREDAKNDAERIRADVEIQRLEAQLEQHKTAADVVKAGMQNKVFWIPWLMAAVPTSLWFGLGMADSIFNGSLPDVAALPPQLKEYADVVFANIFYAGGVVKGIEVLDRVVRRSK